MGLSQSAGEPGPNAIVLLEVHAIPIVPRGSPSLVSAVPHGFRWNGLGLAWPACGSPELPRTALSSGLLAFDALSRAIKKADIGSAHPHSTQDIGLLVGEVNAPTSWSRRFDSFNKLAHAYGPWTVVSATQCAGWAYPPRSKSR